MAITFRCTLACTTPWPLHQLTLDLCCSCCWLVVVLLSAHEARFYEKLRRMAWASAMRDAAEMTRGYSSKGIRTIRLALLPLRLRASCHSEKRVWRAGGGGVPAKIPSLLLPPNNTPLCNCQCSCHRLLLPPIINLCPQMDSSPAPVCLCCSHCWLIVAL